MHIYYNARWKIHEACMLALGSVKTIITENVKNGRVQFDMHGFLAGVILLDLNLPCKFEPSVDFVFLACCCTNLHRTLCSWIVTQSCRLVFAVDQQITVTLQVICKTIGGHG